MKFVNKKLEEFNPTGNDYTNSLKECRKNFNQEVGSDQSQFKVLKFRKETT